MKNPLRVNGQKEISDLPYELELDEYIPLRFRTFGRPLGCACLRLGNYSTKLMELKVQPGNQLVRGLTLTSAPPLSIYPRVAPTRTAFGLPILSTEFEGFSVVDLDREFQVAVSDEQILVYWSDLNQIEALRFGQADFLIQDGLLAGVQFGGLGPDKLKIFRDHFKF